MSKVLTQLYNKSVVVAAAMPVDQSFARPYQLPIGKLEVLLLWGIHVRFHTDSNQSALIQWSLIQKNELPANNILAGPLNLDQEAEAAVTDHDHLVCGHFEVIISTAGVNIQQRTFVDIERIWFPIPICVPRSPTLVIHNQSGGSGTISAQLIATLYYQKKIVGLDFVTGLLKQYIGRRQDPVPNIPRVIDE